jgi:hypothetical protein
MADEISLVCNIQIRAQLNQKPSEGESELAASLESDQTAVNEGDCKKPE